MLELKYKFDSNYRESKMYGLGNSIYNFLIGEKILEKDFTYIQIEKQEILCNLEDVKLREYNLDNVGAYEIILYDENNNMTSQKYGTLAKTADFLKNLNNLFLDLSTIKIRKKELGEIL